MSFSTPVLFCTYNRPELTNRAFEVIRRIQPERLLVSSDGPHPDRPGDTEQVEATRQLIRVDWQCDVQWLAPEQNRGCKRQMAEAINWGFEQHDRLIILEDDCLPDESFFGFCQELLERYAHDPRVMMISGDNFQPEPRSPYSYYFSCYSHIWGWASWRRAWAHFDLGMSRWPEFKRQNRLSQFTRYPAEVAFWTEVFDRQYSGLADTWDFSWAFACWENYGWTILPEVNLVSNIGFGERATHTIDGESEQANRPVQSISEIRHPTVIARDVDADEYTWSNVFDPQRQRSNDRIARNSVGRHQKRVA